MLEKNHNYIMKNKCEDVEKVVSIPVSLFESMKGRYFVGQTETLKVGDGLNAWAGLVNPCNSHINSFLNVFTVSNFSDEYLTVQIWLNTDFPEKGRISHKVSPTNTALCPPPQNKANIEFIKCTTMLPECGVNVYQRIVPPKTTLVSEEDGKFIQPPDGNYVLVIKSSCSNLSKVVVALGWWEKPIC